MNENIVFKFIVDNNQFVKGADEVQNKLGEVEKKSSNIGKAITLGIAGGLGFLASRTTLVKNAWAVAGGFAQAAIRKLALTSTIQESWNKTGGAVTGSMRRIYSENAKLVAAIKGGATSTIASLLGISHAATVLEHAMIGTGIAIVASMGFAVKLAGDFESKMANVQSILRTTPRELGQLSDTILKTSTQVPKSASDLSGAAYTVVSAGFTKPSETGKVVNQAGKAAAAGLTATDVAANALVTTMNAYGLTAEKVEVVSDVLFQVVRQGQTNFEQLSNNLSQFIGIAATSGATLEETGAAYSAITTRMGDADKAATALQAIFRSFINPTEDMTALLGEMGFKTGVAAIKSKGLQELISELTKKVGGGADQMFRLFQNVEAYNGVAALNAQTTEQQAKNLAMFTDKAKLLGTTNEALRIQSKAWNSQLSQIKTTLGSISITMGSAFLPIIKLVTSGIALITRLFAGMPNSLKTLMAWTVAGSGSLLAYSGAWALVRSKLQLVKVVMQALGSTPIINFLNKQIPILPLLGQAYTAVTGKVLLFREALIGVGLSIGAVIAAFEIRNAVSGPMVDRLIGKQNISRTSETLLMVKDSLEGILSTTDKFKDKNPASEFIADVKRISQGLVGRNLSSGWLSAGVQRVDELDKSLAVLAGNGNADKAATQFEILKKTLMDAGVETKTINRAFNDYLLVVKGTIDANGNLQQSDDAVAQARLDEFTKAEAAAKAYQEQINTLANQAKEFLGFAGILNKIETAHQGAAKGADAEADATERAAEAQDKLSEAKDRQADAQKKVDRLRYVTNNAPIVGSDTAKDLADAERDLAKAKRETTKATRDEKGENEKIPATLQEIEAGLDKQIQSYNTFQANLRTLADRKVDPKIIDEIQSMGEEGVDLAKTLANAPPKEFDKIKGQLAQKVRIQGTEFQTEQDRQLKLVESISKVGAEGSVQAILDEMNKIAPGIAAKEPDVKASALALGIVIGQSVIEGINQSLPEGKVELDPNKFPILSKALQKEWDQKKVYTPPAATPVGNTPTLANQLGVPTIVRDVGGPVPMGRSMVINNTGKTEWIVTNEQMDRFRSDTIKRGTHNSSTQTTLVRDGGGPLPAGRSNVFNGTGKTEWVFTSDQLRVLTPMMGKASQPSVSHSSSQQTVFQIGEIKAHDYNDMMRKLDRRRRLAALKGG